MSFGHEQHWVDTPYGVSYRDFDSLTLSVEPEERVGAPLPSRLKSRVRKTLALLVLAGGAWALVANLGLDGVIDRTRSLVEVVVSNAREIAARANREGPVAGQAMDPADPGAMGPEFGQAGTVATLPALPVVQEEASAPAAAEEAPATEQLGEAYAEKAEPAEDAQDKTPQRKRAIAAGLGPDLPNVLLTRLSKADLKNAAYAIKTALAKTPDDASFAWPPKPSRRQALFEVRFVAGAADGCRRYIVTVTKDRWSSTSAALEKCGNAPHAG